MTPTLSDVARRAGVSTATVSRALNEPDRVSPATLEQVLEAVEALSYTPHFGGRALASKRTHTMGAIVPTLDNPIFARGLQAFQDVLSDANVTLLVASSDYDPTREFEQVRTLVARGIDGLLLTGAERPQATYEFLTRRDIPFVLTWAFRGGDALPFIGFDNRAAARELAREVIARGHRHIAMIAGCTRGNDRAAERVAGVREAVPEPDALQVTEARYSIADGRRACARLLARTPRPTAIMCGNDLLAIGAIAEAKAHGLEVPRALSVTGFDDIEVADAVTPRLTTVQIPHREMGESAARALLRIRDGDTRTESVALPTALVLRESLGTA